jgi:hypothetical protein
MGKQNTFLHNKMDRNRNYYLVTYRKDGKLIMGLYEKMYNVMCETEGLEKNLEVGAGTSKYKAIGESEVLNMMKPLFKKYKLIIFPVDGEMAENNSTFESEYNGKMTTKTRNVTQLKVKFKIVDIETGESEYLMSFGNGADSQDKGSGKAFTYAFKAVLSKSFMLFSGEDTENTHSDDIGNPEKPKHDIKPIDNESNGNYPKISDAQAKRLFGIAKGNADLVKSVIARYQYKATKDISTGDYKLIADEIEALANKAS